MILEFNLAIGETKQKEQVAVKNWKKADWNKIKEGLRNTIWPTTTDNSTVEESWGLLRSKLDQLVEENVPTCTFRPRKSDWMTGDILREIRRKRRQWKKAKVGGEEDRAEYEDTAKN